MTAILDTYTQIKAVSLWSNHASWLVNDVFPYDCLFDNPLQVAALQTIVSARPNSLRSCIYMTDSIAQPNCAGGITFTSTFSRGGKGMNGRMR